MARCVACSTYALGESMGTKFDFFRGLPVDHEHGGIHAQHLFYRALQVRELFDVFHANHWLVEVIDLVAHFTQYVWFHAEAVKQAAQRIGDSLGASKPTAARSINSELIEDWSYINEMVSSITSTSEGHSGFSMLFFNSAVSGVVSFKFNFFLAAASSATSRNRLCTEEGKYQLF